MRSSVITGSIFLWAGTLLVLPALSRRDDATPARGALPPAAAAHVERRPLRADLPEQLETASGLARRGDWKGSLAALADANAGTLRSAALRALLAAEAALRLGDLDQAATSAREAAELLGDGDAFLRARALFTAAEALQARGDDAGAARAFVEASTGLPALAAQARLRGASALAGDDPARALSLVAADADAPDPDPAVLLVAARCARATGDEARALAWLRLLHYEHPASPEGREASADPALQGEAAAAIRQGRAAEVLARADRLVEADLSRLAAADVDALRRAGVPAELRDRLDLVEGRLLRAQGQAAKALARLSRAASADGAVGCRAAFHASRAARSVRRAGDAARFMRKAAEGCACEWRDRAAFEIESDARQAGQDETARACLARVARDGVTDQARARAAWRLAWEDWSAGRREAALAAFGRLREQFPAAREAAAARYWSARAMEEGGDAEGARAAHAALASDFPRDWYGLLAAEACGLDIPPPAPCNQDEVLDELGRRAAALGLPEPAAVAVLELEALGLTEDALAEGDAAPAEQQDRAAFRALVLSRAGRSREALREFRRAVPDWRRRADVPPALAVAAWPMAHEELILSAAATADLDPALVFGLVHQESVFDERAVSHAGARGLMQVMPATGRTIARWLGERVTTAGLVEPSRNVRYGTTYLRRLLDESGRVEVALAGYNAGPGRARRWWAATPGQDVALFVENIPFDETRDYVKAIRVNEGLYRARLLERGSAAGQ